jgi:NAD(P)-dependent dehydrogenase (short-subunit alcohol dehydrogenase family)
MGRFDGQVAVVTGAGGGIGREHALLLATEGASVVVNDYGGDWHGNGRSPDRAEQVVKEITEAGGSAVADAHDVAVDGPAVVATAVEAFGGLHLVVNNAGISGGGTIDQIDDPTFRRMLDIHVGGTVAVCRAAWPILREQGYGRVVNTSSASMFGLPGTSAYITAKAGIFGLTRALAQEGARHGVKVNSIMPTAYSRLTAMSTEFGELTKAWFPAEQIAPLVCALLTREAPCTGETFVVGGGRAARVLLATVPGATGLTSIDACLDAFDRILDSSQPVVPANSIDEVRFECEQLGVTPPPGALSGG